MRTLFTLIFTLLISMAYSQDIDVMLEDDSGTTKIDTESKLFINAKKAGVELFAFSTSGCDDSYGNQKIQTKMIENEFKNDTLSVTFEFSDACCISFLGDIEYKDKVLNLKYSSFGEACECRCYYTLEYKIRVEKKIKKIVFNGHDLK